MRIEQTTGGGYVLLMSPQEAQAFVNNEFVVRWIKEDPTALAQVRGAAQGRWWVFGLPDRIGPFSIVIEETP